MPDAGLTICMIDDDEEDAFLARRMFSRHAPSMNFVHRSDAWVVLDNVEALRLVGPEAERFPDFIFLDLNMPRVTGQSILTELKSHARLRKIPVVVFTTSDEQELVDLAYSAGAAAYIVKPQSIDEYGRMVEAFLSFWTSTVKLPVSTVS